MRLEEDILLRDFKPTEMDTPGLGPENRQFWSVTHLTHRDAGDADQFRFNRSAAAMAKYGHEVHRFRHWAVGWIEIIIRPPLPLKTLR